MKRGKCGWHRNIVNIKSDISLFGEMESLTGKWLPCCKRCWNRRVNSNRNIWAGLFNLGMKKYQ